MEKGEDGAVETIYLDNGSTSFPKAPGVGRAMADYVDRVGVNIARGGYGAAYDAAETVLETREALCRLFGFDRPEQVIFTGGVTAALNLLLKGLLRSGDRVAATSMEHNAVLRPLAQLAEEGVEVEIIPCQQDGTLPLGRLEEALGRRPRALVMTHASNVCGTLLPAAEAAALCRRYGVRMILDCAQTGGKFPIDMGGWGVDAVAFAGHKGLLGPQGIGGFLITEELAREVRPLLAGGTGSQSHLETMPDFLPDRFEAGTLNLPGIFGLRAALAYLEAEGIETLRRRAMERTEQLLEGLGGIRGVRVAGLPGVAGRCAVVSLDFQDRDNAEAAYELESRYGVLSRCGLHCAPRAHRTLGTYPQGTVRLTPGHATTAAEIDRALEAVAAVAAR